MSDVFVIIIIQYDFVDGCFKSAINEAFRFEYSESAQWQVKA